MTVMSAGRVTALLLVTCPCLWMFSAPVHAQEASRGSADSSQTSSSTPDKKAPSPSDRVVLKVGNAQVTEAEFESRIGDIESQGEGEGEKAAPSDKDRRKLADDYASVLMLSQRAVANHLDSTPEIKRQLAVARMQVLSDAEFNRLMNQAKPTFEEISKYYSSHVSDYDEVRIRRLFIWKRHQGSQGGPSLSSQDARAHADQIRQAYATESDGKKLSEDLKSSNEGMLDAEPIMFPRGELPPQMEKVAFTLKEGEWSEVQDTPDSLILIQLVKRSHRQLGEVSSLIEELLQGQKMEASLNDLKKKAGIWMDEKYFGTAVAPVPGSQKPASSQPPSVRNSASNNPGENK